MSGCSTPWRREFRSRLAAEPGAGNGVGQIDPRPFVTNPGYARPLGNASTVEYFFFERDRLRTETQHRTDFSLNYSHDISGGAEVFFHGEVLNVLNVYQLCGCGGTVFNNGGGATSAPSTRPSRRHRRRGRGSRRSIRLRRRRSKA